MTIKRDEDENMAVVACVRIFDQPINFLVYVKLGDLKSADESEIPQCDLEISRIFTGNPDEGPEAIRELTVVETAALALLGVDKTITDLITRGVGEYLLRSIQEAADAIGAKH